jgi:PAS domain S-box-containing protein
MTSQEKCDIHFSTGLGPQPAATRVVQSVRNLVQQQDHNAETQTRLKDLQESVLNVVSILQHDIDYSASQKNNKAALGEMPASGLSAGMRKTFAGVLAAERARFDLQQANAARTESTLNALVKYGGALIIWILGVAALLLIYGDKNQIREQLDHRLHTDILESLPVAVCLTSESGVILYANPAAEDVFGYKPGELVARNIAQLHPPRDNGSGPQIPELLAQLLPQEIWSGELSLMARNGDVIKTDSCMANLRVGEKDCRLLLHKPVISVKGQAQTHLAVQFTGQREAAEGTSIRPRAPVRPGSEPTRSPR